MATLAVALAAALALSACAYGGLGPPRAAVPTATPAPVLQPAVVRLGNLPTEDILPLWVAQQKGMFEKAGIKVEIVPFESADERDAAFTAGAIDGFMGDMFAIAELCSAGFKMRVVTICLGASPAEGRFGIVSSPSSGVRSVKGLSGVAIGTSAGTIQEYVLDGLARAGGVPAAEVRKEEVKKLPVRYELLMNNELKAAVLPEPFLTLAVQNGAHLVAADTKGANLTQTVLAFGAPYLAKPEGAEAVNRLLAVWDDGASLVDSDPSSYRRLLVDKAPFPKEIASSYKVSTYPKHQLPAEKEVADVLAWMTEKNLLEQQLEYSDMTWAPGAGQ